VLRRLVVEFVHHGSRDYSTVQYTRVPYSPATSMFPFLVDLGDDLSLAHTLLPQGVDNPFHGAEHALLLEPSTHDLDGRR